MPTPGRPLARRTVIALACLALAACGSAPSATGGASGAASVLPSGTARSAFDLEVGDCFDAGDLASVTEVTILPCAAPHAYEVFGLSTYDDKGNATFPGDEALSAAADAVCRPAFEAYVGTPYDDSDWYGTFLNPSPATWASGDREIACVLHAQDRSPVSGSARGSRR